MPARHPVDPEKSNRVLGFPALITSLCHFYGVPIAPSRVIRPLLTGLSSRSIVPPGKHKARLIEAVPESNKHENAVTRK